MPDLYINAIIATLSAIVSSLLTIFLTHHYQQKQRNIENELKWLEERFIPALNFLGNVLAVVSSTPDTPEGRKRTADEISSMINGPKKDSNVWCIMVLLDPEDTGLRGFVDSVMRYALIEESKEEFNKYFVILYQNLEKLAEEYRNEKQIITK